MAGASQWAVHPFKSGDGTNRRPLSKAWIHIAFPGCAEAHKLHRRSNTCARSFGHEECRVSSRNTKAWRGSLDYQLMSGSWAILSNIIGTGSPGQVLERTVSPKLRRFYRVR